MKTACRTILATIAAMAALAACGTAKAELVTYFVDPTRSVLTASGTYAGEMLGPQLTYSINDNQIIFNGFIISYSGTLNADRDKSADTLQITGGTVLEQNAYAISATSGDSPPSSSFLGSVHSFSFSPTSGVINFASGFDASEVSAEISSGQLDFTLLSSPPLTIPSEVNGSTVVTGSLAFAHGLGSLVEFEGVETLTVPVSTIFTVDVDGSPLLLNLSGNLVAISVAPEPSTVVLFATSAILLLRRRTK